MLQLVHILSTKIFSKCEFVHNSSPFFDIFSAFSPRLLVHFLWDKINILFVVTYIENNNLFVVTYIEVYII